MGGGGGDVGDFRSKVWSMPGGPNCRPKHWRRNTAFALVGIFLVCVPIAVKSAQLEGVGVLLELPSYPKKKNVFSRALTILAQSKSPCDLSGPGLPDLKAIIYAWNNFTRDDVHYRSLNWQRPHEPVRPIPSQMWCKNFGNKEY